MLIITLFLFLKFISYHDHFVCLTGTHDTVMQRSYLKCLYCSYFKIFKLHSAFRYLVHLKIWTRSRVNMMWIFLFTPFLWTLVLRILYRINTVSKSMTLLPAWRRVRKLFDTKLDINHFWVSGFVYMVPGRSRESGLFTRERSFMNWTGPVFCKSKQQLGLAKDRSSTANRLVCEPILQVLHQVHSKTKTWAVYPAVNLQTLKVFFFRNT